MIEVISATTLSETEFWAKAPLGLSLKRLQKDTCLWPQITFANQLAIAHVFNARINAQSRSDILVFVHDDVWIDDFFLADRITRGLAEYDVLGVAGNRRRVPYQPAWAFIDTSFTMDDCSNLSGRVAHGAQPFSPVWFIGPAPAECELLDGVFLATKRSILTAKGILFDPRFSFDFYDLDFCRSARERGLRLGTWPICITHQSRGAFGSPRWQANYLQYCQKWQC
jgi:GT2 family glycosyltransferase